MTKKTLVAISAVVLVFFCTVGATLAWLVDSTDEVKNTFTTAGIEIELIETQNPDGTEVANGVTDWTAQMIPGYTYSKNPKVTVKANSVDCYLFVKFEVTGTATALEYTSNLTGNGWIQGTGDGEDGNGVPTNVWFREVTSSTSDQSWELLKDNQVKISESLTKTDMPTGENAPSLKYTAYASQLHKNATEKFTAAQAWTNVTPSSTTTD